MKKISSSVGRQKKRDGSTTKYANDNTSVAPRSVSKRAGHAPNRNRLELNLLQVKEDVGPSEYYATSHAPSQQYLANVRKITSMIRNADKLCRNGRAVDAQKGYMEAAQAMLILKAQPEYEWDNAMKAEFTRVFKRL